MNGITLKPLTRKSNGRLLDGRTWDEYPVRRGQAVAR